MRIQRATTLAVLVLAAQGTATAQGLYLSTEPGRPAAGDVVRVELTSGAPFEAEATDPTGMRIQRLWNAGRAELDEDSGGASFRPEVPGVQLIASLPRAGEAGVAGVSSFAKALLVVGEPERAESVWRSELGQKLEIVVETDPVTLARDGGALEVQVLFDREPLSGATVVAVAEEATEQRYRQGRTDGSGRVRFDLDHPGRWIVHLAHKSFSQIGDRGWTLYHSSLLLSAGP